jgi:hypothetical protein
MTSFHASVRTFRFPFGEVLSSKPGFNKILSFCILKNEKKKKKMTDWLHYGRTDFVHTLHYIALPLHCIALHCIVHCIALHYITYIAYVHYITCIAYWLNVMLLRHVCSWIVPSVTFKLMPLNVASDRICVSVCVCLSVAFFWLRTSVRTDLLTVCDWTETKLK